MNRITKSIFALTALVSLIMAIPALAAPAKKLPKYVVGSHVPALPPGYATVRIPPTSTYYYRRGVYYAKVSPKDYMIVRPPVGAEVKDIPGSYKKAMFNGVAYYTKAGTYYTRTDKGYRVVTAPVGVTK